VWGAFADQAAALEDAAHTAARQAGRALDQRLHDAEQQGQQERPCWPSTSRPTRNDTTQSTGTVTLRRRVG
jgi:hypothetical protein